MTVCLAALAANRKAIVCVSDKALSYGDIIQWDSDSSKMLPLPNGCLAMFSGNEESTSRLLATLICDPDLGKDVSATLKVCETEYKKTLDDLTQSKFLTPRLLDRSQYVQAISGASINDYIRGIAEEIRRFDMECDLILCGFNASREAFILAVTHPGIATDVTNTGFCAIGSGWEIATSRMLWSEYKKAHPIERVLFDSFDAKVNAELAPGVGWEWEAQLVVLGRETPVEVPKKMRDLVEAAWDNFNLSPFEKWNAVDYLDPPPKNWKKQLRKFAEEVMVKEGE